MFQALLKLSNSFNFTVAPLKENPVFNLSSSYVVTNSERDVLNLGLNSSSHSESLLPKLIIPIFLFIFLKILYFWVTLLTRIIKVKVKLSYYSDIISITPCLNVIYYH